MPNRAAGHVDDECRSLAALLEVEERHYRRLHRLAVRQNSYMKRQDVDRLAANSQEWSRYLAEANEARIARERFVGELARRSGIAIPPGNLEDLIAHTQPEVQRQVRRSLADLKATTRRLGRQNALNHQVAGFCLDLAREEVRIFKNCVTEDAKGCYTDGARPGCKGPGGVLVRQA